MANYNRIAWIYEALSGAVFGKKIAKANSAFLDRIPVNGKVLVVGGGTGKVIENLNELGYHVNVDYVEVSVKMMARAKKKPNELLSIRYFNLPIKDFIGDNYDIIIANFFFDQFKVSHSTTILAGLKPMLKRDGFLIVNDFVDSRSLADRLIMFMMISFFRLFADIEVKSLPAYQQAIKQTGFAISSSSKICPSITASLYSINY